MCHVLVSSDLLGQQKKKRAFRHHTRAMLAWRGEAPTGSRVAPDCPRATEAHGGSVFSAKERQPPSSTPSTERRRPVRLSKSTRTSERAAGRFVEYGAPHFRMCRTKRIWGPRFRLPDGLSLRLLSARLLAESRLLGRCDQSGAPHQKPFPQEEY